MTGRTVPIVLGPTAVGKTELVHRAAKSIEGEVISADSRAIYKGMNIGTATPPESLREELRYHLINFLDPRDRYSAADYREDVEERIPEIRSRGDHRPVVVGGSRLYVLSLTQGIFEGPEADEELRDRLREKPNEELHERLREVDPRSGEKIHPNDTKRLVRALEVYELSGEPISKLKEQTEPLPYRFKLIGLDRPREVLYERIDSRVEEMLDRGLVDEVKDLVEDGFCPDWGAWETIGYKELALHLQGELDLEEAVEEIKKNTRHLAKYQQNWMKKIEEVEMLDLGSEIGPGERLEELFSSSSGAQ